MHHGFADRTRRDRLLRQPFDDSAPDVDEHAIGAGECHSVDEGGGHTGAKGFLETLGTDVLRNEGARKQTVPAIEVRDKPSPTTR